MLRIGKCQLCKKRYGFLNDPSLPKGIVFIGKKDKDIDSDYAILCFKCYEDFVKKECNNNIKRAVKNQKIIYVDKWF